MKIEIFVNNVLLVVKFVEIVIFVNIVLKDIIN